MHSCQSAGVKAVGGHTKGNSMAQVATVTERILEAIAQSPGSRIEDVARACPNLSSDQVFLEVDRLSRTGEVLLRLEGRGIYTLRLPAI